MHKTISFERNIVFLAQFQLNVWNIQEHILKGYMFKF